VGCLIVRDGLVLAAASTGAGGRPHAEEAALQLIGEDGAGADAYVTLEPCGARSSGAPSCAERLVVAGVRRVVIACEDASPFASGQGAERLRAAGVVVETGILQAEAWPLYEGYAHRLKTGAPLVVASVDGAGCEALFEADGDLEPALNRYGAEGYSRLWTPAGGETARALKALGLLAR
jgi:diaminohydroxyphosphoribosylaminopyrimidine deaminase / 5-amino-6-(5-phosphoribosylamino)uracil reductase